MAKKNTCEDLASEMKQLKKATAESEEKFLKVFHSNPCLMALSTLDEGIFIDVNDEFLKVLEYERSEIIGKASKNFNMFTDFKQREMMKKVVNEKGHIRNVEIDILSKNGKRLTGLYSGDIILLKGQPCWLTVFYDITKRKQAEDALKKSRDSLEQRVQERTRELEETNQKLKQEIAERKRTLQVLTENEKKYRDLIEEIPDGIFVIDITGSVLFCNPALVRMFRFDSLDEFMGINFGDLIDQKERDRIFKIFRQALITGESPPGLEVPVRRKDGSLGFVEVRYELIIEDEKVTGAKGILTDITERKHAEEEIQKLALAVRHSSELVNLASLDGMMTFLNEAGSRMLGIDQEDVNTTNIMQVIPEHMMEVVETELLPTLIRGDTWEGQLQYRNLKTGELTDVHAMTFTVKDPNTDEPRFLANVSKDITESVKAEKEKQALEKKLHEAQKLESLGVLAGGIAHDFNNMLMGVLGYADLALVEMPLESPILPHIQNIKKTAIHLADLTRQMLAYSGKGKFVIEPINLSKLVEEMAHLLQVSISKKAVIKFDLDTNLPCIEADVSQIRQVILNLITNASEALGKKSGIISLRTGVVSADSKYLLEAFSGQDLPKGDYIYLEVKDTGHGMDQDTAKKIFDPFFTTRFTGRGLGLSVVLGIMRGHGGGIKVYSQPNQGTTFKLLFPTARPITISLPQKKEEVEMVNMGGIILVADDEEIVCEVTKGMLEQGGFDVLTARDGIEALEVLRNHLEEISAVLLDLTMPHRDGIETFREIRKLRPDLPVILSSGYSEQEATSHFAGEELAGFIQKPYELKPLIATIQNVLKE